MARDIGGHETENRNFDSSFENSYHNYAIIWEHYGREELCGDLGFKLDLLEFSSMLQAKGFFDWLHKVERIIGCKEVSDHVKVKLVTIKLQGRASILWE